MLGFLGAPGGLGPWGSCRFCLFGNLTLETDDKTWANEPKTMCMASSKAVVTSHTFMNCEQMGQISLPLFNSFSATTNGELSRIVQIKVKFKKSEKVKYKCTIFFASPLITLWPQIYLLTHWRGHDPVVGNHYSRVKEENVWGFFSWFNWSWFYPWYDCLSLPHTPP